MLLALRMDFSLAAGVELNVANTAIMKKARVDQTLTGSERKMKIHNFTNNFTNKSIIYEGGGEVY